MALRNILCLTVYESKGLEFNDVIIYNFFNESEAKDGHWKLLNDIIYETVKIPKLSDEILDFDLLDGDNFQDFQRQIKALEQKEEGAEGIEYEEKINIDIKADGYFCKKRETSNIYKQFSQLCVELKFLYVAITRAKNRVIVYDDTASTREPIQKYWENLGAIKIVTKQMFEQEDLIPDDLKQFF